MNRRLTGTTVAIVSTAALSLTIAGPALANDDDVIRRGTFFGCCGALGR